MLRFSLGLFLVTWLLLALGCSEPPAAADSAPEPPPAPSGPQMLPPPPVVPADAFANVAAAMAEVETATYSSNPEDQKRLVRVERWLTGRGASIEPELSALVKDAGAPVASRVPAGRALARLGPAGMPTLLEATASDTKQVRVKAIESLGRIDPPSKEIVIKLVGLLDEKDPGSRRAALLGLSHIGPRAKTAAPELVDKLTGILNNLEEEDTLRTAAHSALKKIDPRKKLVP
jgi:hypothetical protein